MTDRPYEIVVTPPARRAITDTLPEAVAGVIIDFLATALLDNPHRAGTPPRSDLDGIRPARRGTYRVLYRSREHVREVVALRIDHRRDAH